MCRLLIVSNRLPVSISKRKGKISYSPSAGGLATGLSSFYKSYESIWVGWPGIVTQNMQEKEEIEKHLKSENMYPIFLTKRQIENYYEGFSNKTIWPLFHYFSQYTVYNKKYWEIYSNVNKLFCDEIVQIAKSDDVIWLQDYQLMLLPQLIREKLPDASIGFFLHIPFPSFEIFRTLPWRYEILNGLIGSDLLGFQTYDYVRHFISAATRLLGVDHSLNKLTLEDRTIRADSFPIAIDYNKYSKAYQKPEIKREITRIQKIIGVRKIVLSVDRLDYTKAITQRIKAFNNLLENNSEFREKATLILVVVPSRSKVEHYSKLKEEVDELVGSINGKYGTIGWIPVWYLYRNLDFNKLSALYNLADVGLVTPFRDGMNLVAKEYIASKKDGKGVLILSEMAGAADELGDTILINPNDIDDIVKALKTALTMPEDEQIRINKEIQKKLKRYDICRWAEDFIGSLNEVKQQQHLLLTTRITHAIKMKIVYDYQESTKRLLLLDYDGTLVSFSKDPEKVFPDKALLEILEKLCKSASNEVVIISGRKKQTLQEWLGHLNISMVAEHGVWLKYKNTDWEMIEPLDATWKMEISPILELYVDRTPGSFIEEKEYSLVWHYRKTDPGQGEIRVRELVNHLVYMTSNLNLQILEGNKVVEIKNSGVNKGHAASRWINREKWEFILAMGDDWTDEDIFKSLPETAYSIKVGFVSTEAKYKIKSPTEVRQLLKELSEVKTV